MRLNVIRVMLGLFVAVVLGISGCGVGGLTNGVSLPALNTLGGTAAVGYPIVNATVQVKFATGSPLTSTTGSNGAWKVTLSGQTLPCAVEVSGGTINNIANTTKYHSVATDSGVVNVTPLTDLLLANMAQQNPNTWFNGLSGSILATAVTSTSIDTALTNLRTALSGLAPLDILNPITSTFSAVSGDPGDDMLTALRTAIASTNSTYETLLTAASNTVSMTTEFVSVNATLPTAYFGTSSGKNAPTVTLMSPITGKSGTTVIISGTNFNPVPANNSVRFNGVQATVTAASATSLTVTVPLSATTGKVTVRTVFGAATTTDDFTVVGSTGSKASFDVASITFPVQDINTTYAAKTVILSNTGDQDLKFSYGKTIEPNNYYKVEDNCPVVAGIKTLVPASSCSFSITQVAYAVDSLINARSINQTLGIPYTIPDQSLSGKLEINPSGAGQTEILAKVVFNGSAHYPDTNTCPAGQVLQAGACVSFSPVITGMTPTSAAPGSDVVITGSNFSPGVLNNVVVFNGKTAIVKTATATSLTVTVPIGATTGTVTVTAGGKTVTSASVFTVTAGAATGVAGTWNWTGTSTFTNSKCTSLSGPESGTMTFTEAGGLVSTASGKTSGTRTGNTLLMTLTSPQNGLWGTFPETWTWDGANKMTGHIRDYCYNSSTLVLSEFVEVSFTATRN